MLNVSTHILRKGINYIVVPVLLVAAVYYISSLQLCVIQINECMYPQINRLSEFSKTLYASSNKQGAHGISTAIKAARAVLRGVKELQRGIFTLI
jgi:hypothetical protein